MKVTTLESAGRVPFQLDGRIMLSKKHVEAIYLCLQPGEVLPAHINDFDVAVFILEGEGIIASGRKTICFHFFVLGSGNWQSQNSGSISLLRSLSFFDGTTGWAVGNNGGIIHTNIGGDSWSAQGGSTFNWLWSMGFSEPNKGWICGYTGTIIRYVNEPLLSSSALFSPADNMEEVAGFPVV